MDLVCNGVVAKKLDVSIPKCSDTEAAAQKLSKRLVASSLFMVPIAIYRLKMGTKVEINIYSTVFSSN